MFLDGTAYHQLSELWASVNGFFRELSVGVPIVAQDRRGFQLGWMKIPEKGWGLVARYDTGDMKPILESPLQCRIHCTGLVYDLEKAMLEARTSTTAEAQKASNTLAMFMAGINTRRGDGHADHQT